MRRHASASAADPARVVLPGLILQHAVTGPPGRLGSWADDRGIGYRVHRSDEAAPAFDPSEFGWIASLGSSHSVNETDLEWISAEIELLHRAVADDIPVLGLCWGGQALSAALGGEVGAAPRLEKGWLAIASGDPAIPGGPWLHYHSEIFTVPDGAVELAHSPAGPSAFRLGRHLALQFHPEADLPMGVGWAAKDPEQTDASRAAFVREGERWDGPAAPLAEALFDGWWAGVSAPARPSAAAKR